MDHWTLAIEKNTKALTQIVAGLFVMVGGCLNSASPSDEQAIKIGPVTRRILMRVLRTTEAALRRLIVLYVNVHGIKAKSPKPSNRPLPDFASFGSGTHKRTPVFRLFDPRKSLCFISDSTSVLPSAQVQASRLIASTGTATEGDHSDSKTHNNLLGEPRIWIMGNSDWGSLPYVCGICHSKIETGFDQSLRGSRSKCDQHLCHCASARSLESEQETNSAEDKQTEQERKSSQKLLNRLQALNHALKTIPKQARRLARIMAAREDAPAGIKCIRPIRPGIPPGYAKHSKTPEHETLRECHGILRDWESNPP